MERLEENAIEILHMMCERSGCIICDSGGKDSSVLKHIALQAKDLLKEAEKDDNFLSTNKGGVIVMNLDNAETRRTVENCFRTHKVIINPLIDWDDEFLWWYIKKNAICLNPLYGCGNCRVGCIGCPMAGDKRWIEFERYPKYKEAYIRAFDKMLIEREKRGLKNCNKWSTGLKVFKWWMEDDNMDGQLAFDMEGAIYEEYT